MFGKRPQSFARQRQAKPAPPAEGAFVLTAQRSEAAYHVSDGLIHPIRHMVTKLNRTQKMPTNLAVVSALRQEGVSFVAQALAAVVAHDLTRRTCLVDLNWWWPSDAMRELAQHYPGLLALLHGEVSWELAVAPTNHPQLSILPAGQFPISQRPVLARSAALQAVITELGKHFDHLILDVPALLTTSDAIPLASLGNACCVVVHQGVSTRATVKHATAEIDHLPLLGVVMNHVQVATPAWLLKWIPQE